MLTVGLFDGVLLPSWVNYGAVLLCAIVRFVPAFYCVLVRWLLVWSPCIRGYALHVIFVFGSIDQALVLNTIYWSIFPNVAKIL